MARPEFKERDIVIWSGDSARKWMVIGHFEDGSLNLLHWDGMTGDARLRARPEDCRPAFHCRACLDQRYVAGAACLGCGAGRAKGPRS